METIRETKNVWALVKGDIVEYNNKRFIFERAKQKNVLAMLEGTTTSYNLRIPYNKEFTVVGKGDIIDTTPDTGDKMVIDNLNVNDFFVMEKRGVTELYQLTERKSRSNTITSPLTGKTWRMPYGVEVKPLTQIT